MGIINDAVAGTIQGMCIHVDSSMTTEVPKFTAWFQLTTLTLPCPYLQQKRSVYIERLSTLKRHATREKQKFK